jgi:hypothetical protein
MTKVLLKDAPGGPEFIVRCADLVREMSLAFVGEPDQNAIAAVERMQETIKRDLTEVIGAEAAVTLADAFAKAVMARKHRLEGQAAGTA